jgi:hypothetical protein
MKMPVESYYREKGLSEAQAKQRCAEDVFGVGFKTDSRGRPIEQGLGSAANPTDQHFRAMEKYEGKESADKARRDASERRR